LNNRPPAAECRGVPKARIQIGSLCDERIYRKSFKKDSRGLATNHIIQDAAGKNKRKTRKKQAKNCQFYTVWQRSGSRKPARTAQKERAQKQSRQRDNSSR